MSNSVSIYLRIFAFAVRNHRLLEFLNLKWQKLTDRSRNKRRNEYKKLMLSEQEALSQLFPGKKLPPNFFNSLESYLDNFIKEKSDQKYPSIENPYPISFGLDRNVGRFLAYLCFYYQPEVVIETGVANGFSSSYILSALKAAEKGRLISFDDLMLPWHTRERIGLAIPDNLKSRHTIIVGNSIIELKKYLDITDSIDIFIHDSSHTYQNMMKEFRMVWPHIKENGFLLSDDVHLHDAFLDFADEVKRIPLVIKKVDYEDGFFGLIKK